MTDRSSARDLFAATPLGEEALQSFDSMEGLYVHPILTPATASAEVPARTLSGFSIAAIITALAYAAHYLPFAPFRIPADSGFRRPVSAAIIAIILGLATRSLGWAPPRSLDECKRLVKRLMPLLIVLTGAGLDLTLIPAIGGTTLGIIVACIAIAFFSALLFGRMIGTLPKTSILIGVGTAICGTSAIIAAAPILDAEDEDITLSVGTVNLLGLLLLFCFPLMAGLFHMRGNDFGVWAGTSIHAVPQVVAAGFAHSERAGTLATLVKLVRVTLLAPFLILLMFAYARRAGKEAGRYKILFSRMVPPFLWGFLLMALLTTLQAVPTLSFRLASWAPEAVRQFQIPLAGLLVDGGNVLLTIVMAAMGLEVNLRTMSKVGKQALFTGLGACVTLSLFSWLMIAALMA